jgi:hypothetical protein
MRQHRPGMPVQKIPLGCGEQDRQGGMNQGRSETALGPPAERSASPFPSRQGAHGAQAGCARRTPLPIATERSYPQAEINSKLPVRGFATAGTLLLMVACAAPPAPPPEPAPAPAPEVRRRPARPLPLPPAPPPEPGGGAAAAPITTAALPAPAPAPAEPAAAFVPPPPPAAAPTPVPRFRVRADGTVGCALPEVLRQVRAGPGAGPDGLRVLAQARADGGCVTAFRQNEWQQIGEQGEFVQLRLVSDSRTGWSLQLYFLREDLTPLTPGE